MTSLMKKALRRLAALPARSQDRVAQRVLDLPELATTNNEAPSILAILAEKSDTTRSRAEIDDHINSLRDEWDS